MKRELYVFMDSVSQNFGEPFTLANFAELRREFQKICENPAVPAYAVRDTIVIHLGSFVPDSVNPRIEPVSVPTVVLRGDAYNVEEIRGQSSACPSAAPELCSV